MVPDAPESIMTSSCGKGTRLVQLPTVDQLPPAPDLVWVAGVVVVMPVLPPQSPKWVAPDAAVVHVAAPDAVIS